MKRTATMTMVLGMLFLGAAPSVSGQDSILGDTGTASVVDVMDRPDEEIRSNVVISHRALPVPEERGTSDLLALIVLGALLGAAGQGIRAVVGIKKSNDSDAQTQADAVVGQALLGFKPTQLVVSVCIALCVGALAGVLAAVNAQDMDQPSGSLLTTFLAAGYAGTDFIEGFMKRTPPLSVSRASTNELGSYKAN